MEESFPTSQPLSIEEYNERLIRPSANVTFFAWLLLLGIPFLLLFMIYSKGAEQTMQAHPSPVIHMESAAPLEAVPVQQAEFHAVTAPEAHTPPKTMAPVHTPAVPAHKAAPHKVAPAHHPAAPAHH